MLMQDCHLRFLIHAILSERQGRTSNGVQFAATGNKIKSLRS